MTVTMYVTIFLVIPVLLCAIILVAGWVTRPRD